MNTIDDLEFNVPEEISKYTAHSAEIAIMILNFILSNDGMNKKEFADLVGKTPSDVTRWISGSHNFTIQTLSLIEAKTGMQIIRDLSDANRRKYLKGEVFENLNENEMYSELMEKYLKVLKELERLKADKLEGIHQKISMANVCWIKYDEANEYFTFPNHERFTTSLDPGVVILNLNKGLQLTGQRKKDNVLIKVREK